MRISYTQIADKVLAEIKNEKFSKLEVHPIHPRKCKKVAIVVNESNMAKFIRVI